MKNNEIWNPAGSVELAHQQALTWVSDAYLFHLVSLHRRPVYRHQYGDISLNQPALQAFIDSYLEDKGWDMEKRRAHYINFWTSSNICIAAIRTSSTGEPCHH